MNSSPHHNKLHNTDYVSAINVEQTIGKAYKFNFGATNDEQSKK